MIYMYLKKICSGVNRRPLSKLDLKNKHPKIRNGQSLFTVINLHTLTLGRVDGGRGYIGYDAMASKDHEEKKLCDT